MKMSSPGDSSQPASREPSITVSAPATRAFGMSPEYCSPPSPISGTPAGRAASAASYIAVTCGTPTPATRSEEPRLNSSHVAISYAVFCLKKQKKHDDHPYLYIKKRKYNHSQEEHREC